MDPACAGSVKGSETMFGKKKENDMDENAKVKILGIGCKNCKKLEENVRTALKEGSVDVTVGHVTDMKTIASYGVMSTPALVFGDKVVSSGKVLSVEEAKALISANLELLKG